MVEPLRHRQTKGAETDMPGLPPPRHIPTLPRSSHSRSVETIDLLDPEPTAQADPLATIVSLNGNDGPCPLSGPPAGRNQFALQGDPVTSKCSRNHSQAAPEEAAKSRTYASKCPPGSITSRFGSNARS